MQLRPRQRLRGARPPAHGLAIRRHRWRQPSSQRNLRQSVVPKAPPAAQEPEILFRVDLESARPSQLDTPHFGLERRLDGVMVQVSQPASAFARRGPPPEGFPGLCS